MSDEKKKKRRRKPRQPKTHPTESQTVTTKVGSEQEELLQRLFGKLLEAEEKALELRVTDLQVYFKVRLQTDHGEILFNTESTHPIPDALRGEAKADAPRKLEELMRVALLEPLIGALQTHVSDEIRREAQEAQDQGKDILSPTSMMLQGTLMGEVAEDELREQTERGE